MSPKRTGLGVPHGSSSTVAGAADKTKQGKKSEWMEEAVGEIQPVKWAARNEKLSGVDWV